MNATLNQPPTLRAILDATADFLRANAERFRTAPAAMTGERLLQALAFHATRGTLALIWHDQKLIGAAIAWRTTAKHIEQCEREDRNVFDWQPNDPHGDAVYLALVCTTQRRAMRPLARYYLDRWPDWAALKQFAHRRGRLVRENGLLNRLAKY